MHRRELLAAMTAAALTAPTAGCFSTDGGDIPPLPWPKPPTDLVDAHCHLFNASDLPTIRFVKIVFLHKYRKQAKSVIDIEDPDAVDGLVELLAFILGVTGAPTAADEIKVLKKEAAKDARADNTPANAAAVQAAVGKFVSANSGPVAAEGGDAHPAMVKRIVVQGLLDAAAGGKGRHRLGVAGAPIAANDATQIAQKAYSSKTDLGTYLRWFALVTRYRHVLADDLYQRHLTQHFTPRLLSPAMVDYDKWLGENVDGSDKSPLPDQVTLMGILSRRPGGPPIHGYVAFDPLRQAYWDANVERRFNSMDLVRRAVMEEGFVGVKLYPPMGFRPYGNLEKPAQTYPDKVDHALNGVVGAPLNAALGMLFDFCEQQGAVVLAHAGESVDAGPDYAKRGDPAYWLPVFQKWPKLRVCLAHFGSFTATSAATPNMPLPEGSWEWTLGRFLKTHPDAPVFTDLSYMTDIFGKSPNGLKAYAALVRRFIDEFDPEARHLVFGTDWIMLGLDGSYPIYSGGIRQFLIDSVGLDDVRIRRIFSENATRFLGLDGSGANRARIDAFRAAAGAPKLVFA